MSIKVGSLAPDFTLPVNGGGEITLSDFIGKNVVLYFYPKDNTPGCTQEGCDFRDNFARISDKNTVIIGVSKDSIDKHNKFADAQKFQFKLASDANSDVCEKYGVWQEKSFLGKKYMGIVRSTFLIDPNGIIKREWRDLKVAGHVDEVLKELSNA